MSAKYRWNPAAECAELDGTWVIMNANQATLTRLSGVGGSIWSMLRDPLTAEKIADNLIVKYDVSREEALTDVERFLRELHDIGAVELVS